MTAPDSSAPPPSGKPAGARPPKDDAGRRLAAGLAAAAAGAIAFAVLLALGILLSQRLWGSSGGGFYATSALFGAAGLYAGWLAGVMVFSAVRGEEA